MNVFERFREAWQAFRGRDHPSRSGTGVGGHVTQFKGWDTPVGGYGGGWYAGPSTADRPDRMRLRQSNERTIVNAAYNRIALDVARVEVHHAMVDANEFFTEAIPGDLEDLFNVEANLDQTSFAYMIDLVMSMFDEGVVAEVPVDFDTARHRLDGEAGSTPQDIREIRTGKIVEWRPQEVTVECYDARTGQKERIPMGKREVAIQENPFYSVMNEKNSIYQRLIRKLNVLDAVDQNYSSDKLNLIMQLPYIVRTDVKRKEAEQRLKDVEAQLQQSQHGIAWVDGTEKIIQLSKPVENNLQSQVEWLTNLFFSQIGITQEILNGTADEKAMANYMDRCVGVLLESICAERRRKWLTKEQRENGESIVYVQDPLRLIPATSLSDIFDKLSRNAILSPNECRGVLGYKPSEDPAADQLVNRNMPMSETPNAATDDAAANEEEGGMPAQLEHSAYAGRIMPGNGFIVGTAPRKRMDRSKVPRKRR